MGLFQIKALLFFLIPLFISIGVFCLSFFLLKKTKNKRITQYRDNKRWGGLIIALLFIFLLLLFQTSIKGFLLQKDFISLIFGVLILFIGGIFDDLVNLNWKKQIFFHFCAASLAVFVGDTINHIRLPWGEIVYFPAWLSILSSYLWIILIINSLNWFDGIDGLASSISLINLLLLALLSISPIVNQPNTSLLCLIVSGILMGFLFYNFYPAKIILGSAGVWTIGFIIAVISLYSGGKIATTALIFGFPIIDFLLVSIKRIAAGMSPTKGGDRLHFHENLSDRGWKPYEITIIISLISFLFGVGAVILQTKGKFFLLVILITFFLLFGLPLKKIVRFQKK